MLLGGLALGVASAVAAKNDEPKPAEAPAPRPADASRLYLGFSGHVRFLTPDGKEVGRLTGADAVKAGAEVHTKALLLGSSPPVRDIFAPCGRAAPDGRLPLDTRKGLYLLTPGDPPTAAPVNTPGGGVLFAGQQAPYLAARSPDSRRAVALRYKAGLFGGGTFEHHVADLAAGTTERAPVPEDHRVVDWSPDGSWFLTIRDDQRWTFPDGWTHSAWPLCKVSAEGKGMTILTPLEDSIAAAAIAPDGKRVAYLKTMHTPVGEGKDKPLCPRFELIVLDLGTGDRRVIASEPGGRQKDGTLFMNSPVVVRWSPDGTRVAFAYEHRQLGEPFVAGWRVGVAAADGSRAKTVFARDYGGPKDEPLNFTLLDWR